MLSPLASVNPGLKLTKRPRRPPRNLNQQQRVMAAPLSLPTQARHRCGQESQDPLRRLARVGELAGHASPRLRARPAQVVVSAAAPSGARLRCGRARMAAEDTYRDGGQREDFASLCVLAQGIRQSPAKAAAVPTAGAWRPGDQADRQECGDIPQVLCRRPCQAAIRARAQYSSCFAVTRAYHERFLKPHGCWNMIQIHSTGILTKLWARFEQY